MWVMQGPRNGFKLMGDQLVNIGLKYKKVDN